MTINANDKMNLSITRSLDGSADVVRILGDVDLSNTHALGRAARRPIDADPSAIYVDLGGTTFMGSTPVAFLVQLANHDRARRRLVLCRPTPMASRVIQMTGWTGSHRSGPTCRRRKTSEPQHPSTRPTNIRCGHEPRPRHEDAHSQTPSTNDRKTTPPSTADRRPNASAVTTTATHVAAHAASDVGTVPRV
jgi:anti-anti-sigma factor